jgi:hypothetical protein
MGKAIGGGCGRSDGRSWRSRTRSRHC